MFWRAPSARDGEGDVLGLRIRRRALHGGEQVGVEIRERGVLEIGDEAATEVRGAGSHGSRRRRGCRPSYPFPQRAISADLAGDGGTALEMLDLIECDLRERRTR